MAMGDRLVGAPPDPAKSCSLGVSFITRNSLVAKVARLINYGH